MQNYKTTVVTFSRNKITGYKFCSCSFCSGPNRGHYITIVKSHGLWLLFDDDIVEVRSMVIVVATSKYLWVKE